MSFNSVEHIRLQLLKILSNWPKTVNKQQEDYAVLSISNSTSYHVFCAISKSKILLPNISSLEYKTIFLDYNPIDTNIIFSPYSNWFEIDLNNLDFTSIIPKVELIYRYTANKFIEF